MSTPLGQNGHNSLPLRPDAQNSPPPEQASKSPEPTPYTCIDCGNSYGRYGGTPMPTLALSYCPDCVGQYEEGLPHIILPEICENCEKNEGQTNSRYWLDENFDGHWVCIQCEQEIETEHREEVWEMPPDTICHDCVKPDYKTDPLTPDETCAECGQLLTANEVLVCNDCLSNQPIKSQLQLQIITDLANRMYETGLDHGTSRVIAYIAGSGADEALVADLKAYFGQVDDA